MLVSGDLDLGPQPCFELCSGPSWACAPLPCLVADPSPSFVAQETGLWLSLKCPHTMFA